MYVRELLLQCVIPVFCDVGLTMYEAGGGGPLPKNGEEWHNIREGKLKELQHHSRDFNDLIKVRHVKGIRHETFCLKFYFF
jgi:hypothetical protein